MNTQRIVRLWSVLSLAACLLAAPRHYRPVVGMVRGVTMNHQTYVRPLWVTPPNVAPGALSGMAWSILAYEILLSGLAAVLVDALMERRRDRRLVRQAARYVVGSLDGRAPQSLTETGAIARQRWGASIDPYLDRIHRRAQRGNALFTAAEKARVTAA